MGNKIFWFFIGLITNVLGLGMLWKVYDRRIKKAEEADVPALLAERKEGFWSEIFGLVLNTIGIICICVLG